MKYEEEERIRRNEKAQLYFFPTYSWWVYNKKYLVPSEWMSKWSSYVSSPTAPAPPNIDNSAFICPHGKLNCEIPRISNKESFVMIDESYWEILTRL